MQRRAIEEMEFAEQVPLVDDVISTWDGTIWVRRTPDDGFPFDPLTDPFSAGSRKRAPATTGGQGACPDRRGDHRTESTSEPCRSERPDCLRHSAPAGWLRTSRSTPWTFQWFWSDG